MDEVIIQSALRIKEAAEEILLAANNPVVSGPPNDPVPTLPTPPAPSNTRPIAFGKQVSVSFRSSVFWIESQLGLDANKLMACMKFESDLNPKARNPQSSATGLIQFMDATVKAMLQEYPALRNSFPNVNRARDLVSLNAEQQLGWVYYYFRGFGSNLGRWSIEDTYMAILLPVMIGKPLDETMRWNAGAYRVNRGLDINKDGKITKREAAAHVKRLYEMGMTEDFLG